MQYKLKKISDNKNNLRTEEVIGESLLPPSEGDSFTLIGAALHVDASHRLVSTSIIVTIEATDDPKKIVIHTLNSTYEITEIGKGILGT